MKQNKKTPSAKGALITLNCQIKLDRSSILT